MEEEDEADFLELQMLQAMYKAIEDENIAGIIMIGQGLEHPKGRSSAFFRKRWDSEYLMNLAIQENTFVSEYRLDPGGFQILVDMLRPALDVNEDMAGRSMATSGSGPISTDSRLAAALIMLSGGRYVEAMRTHGLSKSSVYKNLRRVVRAINRHPNLTIACDNTPRGLRLKAAGFKSRSEQTRW